MMYAAPRDGGSWRTQGNAAVPYPGSADAAGTS